MSQPQRLKVLFVTPWYPHPDNPMSGIFVHEHAKAVSHFHDVVVLHGFGRAASLPVRFSLERDHFNDDSQLSSAEQIPSFVMRYRKSLVPKMDRIARQLAMQRAIKETVEATFAPDLIHAHIHRMALPSYLFGRKNKIPHVVTEQHSAFSLGTVSRADVLEAKLAFSQAAAVMPVSNALQQAVESYGIRGNFQIVPNVVDTNFFTSNPVTQPPPAGRGNRLIRLLSVGGMPTTHVKGYPHLLEALASLESSLNWHLDIIGDGPVKNEYIRQVEALNIHDKVTFHGFQPKTNIVAAMNQADIFVLASIWDSMPCVLIEAMSTGLPIVATRTGGIPEVVTPKIGLLAEPANAESLRSALSEMMQTYKEYSAPQISRTAQAKYSFEAVGKLFDAVYRNAIDDKRS